jgi:hypothetical protein
MHRSGTSAVTRALHLLGLDAGPSAARMEPAPSNESGHWEIEPLTEANERLLRAAGGRWSAPPQAVTTVGDAAGLLAEVFGDQRWVWKDPRLCLLLAPWREVIDPEPTAVVVLRHPGAIAASLARRNEFATPYSLALWERYLRELWTGLGGLRTLVLDYDALLADPAGGVATLAAFLGLSRPTDEAVGSLDAGARHHEAHEVELTSEQHDLLRGSRGLLGAHDRFPAVELGPETPNLQLAFAEHARMAAFEDAAQRLAGEKAGVEAELDRQTVFLHNELERRSAEASQLAEDVMAARAEAEALRAHLDRITHRWPVRLYLKLRRGFRD